MEIGLALSGGGLRAAAFHAGVLRWLAVTQLMDAVAQISTVSGGSLAVAATMSLSDGPSGPRSQLGLAWPTADQYLRSTYPALRRLLASVGLLDLPALGWKAGLKALPALLSSRAALLSMLLQERWGIRGTLRDLPTRPNWWINTTCFETGKNWRFSRGEMGDWQFGRHYDPPFLVAEAAAASAAVPYVIGALRLRVPADGWFETDPATREPVRPKTPSFPSVRLWDGGAYENLGLEPLFKPQSGLIGCDFLICSDASGPLPATGRVSLRSLARGQLTTPRLFEVASDQIRSLRSRMLVREFQTEAVAGTLLRMGNSVRRIDRAAARERSENDYDRFLPDAEVALARAQPTELRALSLASFDRMARHGYEVASATATGYWPAKFVEAPPWPGEVS
jgi:NTE family protein